MPKRRIGLFYAQLYAGGAELLTLALAKALRENGYRVELVTTASTDWPKIRKILGIGKEAVDAETVIPPFIHVPTIYSKFVYWLFRDAIMTPLMKREFDLTINTWPVLPVVFSDILYVHFPFFLASRLDEWSEKYSHTGGWAYSLPFRELCRLFIKAFNSLEYRPVVLTNSTYIQRAIEYHLRVKADVVYPPVDTRKYSFSCSQGIRRNIVLTISRFSQEKNLDEVLAVAKDTPEASFVILGESDDGKSDYVERLRRKAEQIGMSDRVSLIVNAGENEKAKLLSQAKVYLHTMKNEHFGISIVEAMSAGLVPLVHRSGGPWLDILKETEGLVGYSYRNSREAAAIISELIKNDSRREWLSKNAVKRAKAFDSSVFESSMIRIVERILATRSR